ncbi:hypothetical protein GCM10010349_19050 [Streptomyces flavofungini]|nr:hypothetical protein GCM10010349_19050 [Streptomyces flavofungini]
MGGKGQSHPFDYDDWLINIRRYTSDIGGDQERTGPPRALTCGSAHPLVHSTDAPQAMTPPVAKTRQTGVDMGNPCCWA